MSCQTKYYLLLLLILFVQCSKEEQESAAATEMQSLVKEISAYTKNRQPGFNIIPQNGMELAFVDLDPNGALEQDYLDAVDAFGIESLYYEGSRMEDMERVSEAKSLAKHKPVFVAEYIDDPNAYTAALQINKGLGFIPFIRTSDNYDYQYIPSALEDENARNILEMEDARNFLYLISTDAFSAKDDMLSAIANTNYDLVLIDLFFNDAPLTTEDLARIRFKANAGRRLLVAYVNIGAAENYRYYWQSDWKRGKPSWLKKNYPGYPDEIYVEFWNEAWKEILFGNGDAYLDRIIDAGFDGAYLDNVEAYYFLYHN
ncbi:MAG: endo alpha-1,4 polygalactosaminidase [Saprospiraceae bacterium]|nr:endo alpha-1,4 polygalactosaminidase [Saprospiraceae bacterium]MCB9322080.1 endo alpha-1,4 polygalactosaminidase [Lewinellaceae bacterium]